MYIMLQAKRQDELAALKDALQILDATSFTGSSSKFSAPFASGRRSFLQLRK
jgi:hypothetical protein